MTPSGTRRIQASSSGPNGQAQTLPLPRHLTGYPNVSTVSNKLRRIAFVGGFEPRRCGIATFTHDLCEAVSAAQPSLDCYAAAVNDRSEGYRYPQRVRFEIAEKELSSYRAAADYINFNNADILCVQHEFGIYGGPAGSHIIELLKEARMPVVTTLHTILQSPSPAQRSAMDDLARHSDRIVVMADKGLQILEETYGVSRQKIDVIPHGIPDLPFAEPEKHKAQLGVTGREVLLTFGLLGPGKGIEHAIKALPAIVERHPNVVYLVIGATHPHLVAEEGERYRLSLERLAEDLKMTEHIIFYNRFVSTEDLAEFIGATDVYITPYPNADQITSGTLACVFGAGKAVVSTPYWHAKELLADDRGSLVGFGDSHAIANAVLAYLDQPERLDRTRAAAFELGRHMTWPAVAHQYLDTFQRACADHAAIPRAAFADWTLAKRPQELPPLKLDHLTRLSDRVGIFQHALYCVPNYNEGYCADDNARAFVLCNLLSQRGSESTLKVVSELAATYLAFLAAAFDPSRGRFKNFMSHGCQWLERQGSEDSHARSLWAMAVGANRSQAPGQKLLCEQLFEQALPATLSFSSPRSWAFALLAVHEKSRNPGDANNSIEAGKVLSHKLIDIWSRYATPRWPWFEASVTYENARLPQALIRHGIAASDREALKVGLESLLWLVSVQSAQTGCFRPIGCKGFYPRDGKRAHFDQQPIEAQATVSACLEAFRATKDETWELEAKRAFEWFLGRNDLGIPLYDFTTGGCFDGLHPDRINQNQGAESTLAFHLARVEMSSAQRPDRASTSPAP